MNRISSLSRLGLLFCLSLAVSLPRAGGGAEQMVSLFNGKDLAGWRAPTGEWRVVKGVGLYAGNQEKLTAARGAGVLLNGSGAAGKTTDLVTQLEFGDLQAHIEFCIPKHSNSGIYLMGRYELQIYDSFGKATDAYPGIECGGIYPRWVNEKNIEGHSPSVNASRAPGEWQTFDITFRAPRFDAAGKKIANAKFVKVIHNGKVIHENVELNGPTRGALAEDEKPVGPIRLQGDHGPVAYRNLWVKSFKE